MADKFADHFLGGHVVHADFEIPGRKEDMLVEGGDGNFGGRHCMVYARDKQILGQFVPGCQWD